MPKDVIITPANSYVEFRDTNSNVDAMIYLDNSRNLNIQNPNGSITFGNTAANLYIGDGTSVVDIVFEQNGSVRALTGKTLTLGQSDSSVAFAGNVTNGFRVTSGNVGIGTTTPAASLQVVGGAIMPAVGNTATAGIQFPSDPGGGTGDRAYIRYFARTGESMTLLLGTENDTDDHIAVVPGGNFGVGTITPSSKLHVIGTANVTANLTLGAGAVGSPSLTTAGDDNTGLYFPASDALAVTTGGTERARYFANGWFGHGTSTPGLGYHIVAPGIRLETNDGNFDVVQAVSGWTNSTYHQIIRWLFNSTYDDHLYLASGGNAAVNTQSALIISENSGLLFGKGNTNSNTVLTTVNFTVNNSGVGYFRGNVGIGTTNPTSNLHVNGSSILGGAVSSSRRIDIDSSGRAVFAYGDNTLVSQITLDNLSADANTDHGSGILWRLATNASSTAINAGRISVAKQQVWTSTTSTQDAYMAFSIISDGNLSERMRIDSTGNVGIGITAPTSNLHVVGNANITLGINTTTINVTTVNAQTYLTSTGANVFLTAINAANTVRVSQNNNSTLSSRQLNFVNTATVTISVTDSGNGNANIAFTSAGGGGNTSITHQSFTGDGNTTIYTLSSQPEDIDHTLVFVDLVYQPQTAYSLNGNDLEFDTAPDNGVPIDVYVYGAGGTDVAVASDRFLGTGSCTSFTLSQSGVTNRTLVYLDGVSQRPTVDYQVSGTGLSFNVAPANATVIEARTFSNFRATDINVAPVSIESDTFTGTGSCTVFTLSQTGTTDSTFVFINGVAQKPGSNYTVANNVLTMVSAPANGSIVEARTIGQFKVIETSSKIESDVFNGDGNTTVFLVSASSTTKKAFVYIDGVAQKPYTDYVVTGNRLSFVEAPPNGVKVEVRTFSPFIVAQETLKTLNIYARSGAVAIALTGTGTLTIVGRSANTIIGVS